MIQARLIGLAHPEASAVFQTPKKDRDKEYVKDSPRFRRSCFDQESQTDFDFSEVAKVDRTLQKKKEFKQEDKMVEEIEEMPLTPVKTVEKKSKRIDRNNEKRAPQLNIF